MFTQPIVYWMTALLSMSGLHGADDLAGHVVFEQGDTLYGRIDPAGDVEELSDISHYEKADHAGGRSYVLLRQDDLQTWLTVLECDAQGKLQRVRTVRDEKLEDVTAILDANVLPDGRLCVVLHGSPSLDVAVVIDPESKRKTFMLGTNFTWDKSGRHIAYFLQPSGGAADNIPAQLWIDGHKVCDGPAGETGELSWDASGTSVSATFPQAGKKDLSVVIRAADGVTVAQTTD